MHELEKLSGGPIEVATPITMVHPGEVVRLFLQHHGCIIESISQSIARLIYPAGSTRQELYLRTFESRYRVLLPDGIELREVEPRGRVSNVPMVSVIVDAHSEPELEYYLAYVEQSERERKDGHALSDRRQA